MQTRMILHRTPPRLRWVHQLVANRSHAANCDDRRFGMVADYPVIMRCTSDAANEASGVDRHTGRWVKIVTTVAPPSAGYHHTQPISNIGVRRAHEAGPLRTSVRYSPGSVSEPASGHISTLCSG